MAESTEAYLKNDTNNTSIVCLLENDVCNVLFYADSDVDERIIHSGEQYA